jgi:hypothetical protein
MVFSSSGGTERMRIDSSGNVGIGTSSPGSTLTVKNNGAGAVQLSTTDGTVTSVVGYIFGPSASFGTASNHPVNFLVNNSFKMTITSGGNVGIGTSSPASYAALQISRTDDPVFAISDEGEGTGYFAQESVNTIIGTEGAVIFKTSVSFGTGPIASDTE